MRYLVIMPRDPDISVMDDETFETDCGRCGVQLTLLHLFDADREHVWFGGHCGNCGQEIEVHVGWTSEY